MSTQTLALTLNSSEEFDAVIAALRLLACALNDPSGDPITVEPNDGDIGSILTNEGEHAGLTYDQIHDLADRFQGC